MYHDDNPAVAAPANLARREDRAGQIIWYAEWYKFSGPLLGEVEFSENEIEMFEESATASTAATFSRPGDYRLILQVVDNPSEGGSYQFHCCWTNAYVDVTVTP